MIQHRYMQLVCLHGYVMHLASHIKSNVVSIVQIQTKRCLMNPQSLSLVFNYWLTEKIPPLEILSKENLPFSRDRNHRADPSSRWVVCCIGQVFREKQRERESCAKFCHNIIYHFIIPVQPTFIPGPHIPMFCRAFLTSSDMQGTFSSSSGSFTSNTGGPQLRNIGILFPQHDITWF